MTGEIAIGGTKWAGTRENSSQLRSDAFGATDNRVLRVNKQEGCLDNQNMECPLATNCQLQNDGQELSTLI